MISFFDFSSQLLFSLFEVVSAAVILLFGWYFARVIGWNFSKYFGRSKFYASFKRVKWLAAGPVRRLNLPWLVDEIVKWWIILAFVTVSVAIIGFGAASRFLGAVLEDSARAVVAIIIIGVVVLVADYLPKAASWKLLRRSRDPQLFARIAVFAVWLLAILAVAFVVKLASLKIVIRIAGVILAVAISAMLLVAFGAKERVRWLAVKIARRLKKTG
jgi:hypothetical protein